MLLGLMMMVLPHPVQIPNADLMRGGSLLRFRVENDYFRINFKVHGLQSMVYDLRFRFQRL